MLVSLHGSVKVLLLIDGGWVNKTTKPVLCALSTGDWRVTGTIWKKTSFICWYATTLSLIYVSENRASFVHFFLLWAAGLVEAPAAWRYHGWGRPVRKGPCPSGAAGERQLRSAYDLLQVQSLIPSWGRLALIVFLAIRKAPSPIW